MPQWVLSHDGRHSTLILCTAYFVASGIAITIVLQMHKAMVYFLIIRCDSKNKFSTTFSWKMEFKILEICNRSCTSLAISNMVSVIGDLIQPLLPIKKEKKKKKSVTRDLTRRHLIYLLFLFVVPASTKIAFFTSIQKSLRLISWSMQLPTWVFWFKKEYIFYCLC